MVSGRMFRNAGIFAPRAPLRTLPFAGGHNPDMAKEAEPSRPTGRDYGCGLVAALAVVMLTGSALGAIAALYTNGLSFSLIFGATFSLLFWYWIAMGAWRRTTWSSRP